MILAALSGFLRHMPFHQERIDIIIRVPFAALMDGSCAFSQRQNGDSIILCDHNVPAPAQIDQSDINRVGSGSDHLDSAVI